MTTTESLPEISLWMHHCKNRNSYRAIFATEEQALSYLADRGMTHAWGEMEEEPIDQRYERLLTFLYPICEHGLSEALCEGPQHYPMDDPYAW
jgi:hypothetical protein